MKLTPTKAPFLPAGVLGPALSAGGRAAFFTWVDGSQEPADSRRSCVIET